VFCDSHYQEEKRSERVGLRAAGAVSVPAGAKKNSSDSQEELFNMF
jgi:hypothetical protein